VACIDHVRLMDQAAPAHQALHLSVMSRHGSGQFGTWRGQPGRPGAGHHQHRALLLMLGVLRRFGQREREREREREAT